MVSASRKSRPLAPRSSATASTPGRLSEGWLPSTVRWVSLISRNRSITPLANAAISGDVRTRLPNTRAVRPFETSGASAQAIRAGPRRVRREGARDGVDHPALCVVKHRRRQLVESKVGRIVDHGPFERAHHRSSILAFRAPGLEGARSRQGVLRACTRRNDTPCGELSWNGPFRSGHRAAAHGRDHRLRFAGGKHSTYLGMPNVTGRLDVERDAERAFTVLERGGIAILPMSVGYSAIGGSAAALKRIFETKRRTPSKLNAMLGDLALHRELHVLDQKGWDVAGALIEDCDLPLGAIAPARMDHPILRRMEPEALEASTSAGTVLMLLNAGPFHAAITRLSREALHPLFGSSANLSLSGTKFRVEDIEPEVIGIADIVIDHGLRLYHLYRASSTPARPGDVRGRSLRRMLRADCGRAQTSVRDRAATAASRAHSRPDRRPTLARISHQVTAADAVRARSGRRFDRRRHERRIGLEPHPLPAGRRPAG